MKPPQLLAVRVPSSLQSPLQPLSKRFAVLTDKFLQYSGCREGLARPGQQGAPAQQKRERAAACWPSDARFTSDDGGGAARRPRSASARQWMSEACLELGNLHATKAHTGLRCVSVGALALQASEAPGFIPSTGKQDQAPLGREP